MAAAAADNIFGGLGADQLTGGAGADVFYYSATGESTAASRDTITDFTTGADKINLQTLGGGAVNVAYDGANTVVTFVASGGGTALSILAVGQVRFSDIQAAAGVTFGGNGAATGDVAAEHSPMLIGHEAVHDVGLL